MDFAAGTCDQVSQSQNTENNFLLSPFLLEQPTTFGL